MMNHRIAFALLAGAACIVAPSAYAQQAEAREYDLAAQDLGTAINRLAAASGQQIIVADTLIQGRRAPRLRGRYSAEAALLALLAGTRLRVVTIGNTFVIQRSDVPDPDALGGDVIVTGTRIRGRGPVGSEIVTIDRKAIDQGGFSTTQQIIQSIPQNFAGGANEYTGALITAANNGNAARGVGVNLRGLGQNSTLLLINGDRPPLGGAGGTFADVSVIPASVIERIEIVPDGSSAIYGSDAVAGVVNVVTRLNFKGVETSVRLGTADGDSQEYQFSQLFGTRWSSGNAVIAYEFYERDALAAADRDYATDDLRRFGGPDRRSSFANPGTIVAGGINFAIPTDQDGTRLAPSQLSPGTVNLGDRWLGTDILPSQRRHSMFAAVSQNLGSSLRLYANGLATWRTYDQAVQPTGDSRRTVPIANPFYVDPIGTRQPVGVNYSFLRDLGPERNNGKSKAIGGTAGLAAEIGPWSIDSHGTWGKQDETYATLNRVNTARLALALADTNPATAYNLVGDGPRTNVATIDAVRGYITTDWAGTSWSAALRADGPLVSLPAGSIRLAVGSEYREDRYRLGENVSYISALTPTVTAPAPLPGVRVVKAAYAEVLIPLFADGMAIPGLRRLNFSAAVRVEDYSDFGSTTNPKLSFAWDPVAGISFRGSYGTSFRAPLFTELRQDPGSIAYFAFPVADPQSPTGTSNLLVIRGNDPNLRPEHATSWSLGVDFKPRFILGFRASGTWFKVNYRDRIATPASNLANFLINRDIYNPILKPNPSAARIAEVYASPFYRNFFGVPSTATFVAEADARLQNLSVVKQSGLDFDLAYDFNLAGGRAEVGGAGTYIFYIRQALTATAKPIDVVNTVGNPVNLRMRGRIGWSGGAFSATVFANYTNSYTNRTTTPPERVASWTTFDLNVGYRFKKKTGPLAGLRISLNATNLLDRDPPYVTYLVGAYTSGFDAENASPLGRVVSFQLTKQW